MSGQCGPELRHRQEERNRASGDVRAAGRLLRQAIATRFSLSLENPVLVQHLELHGCVVPRRRPAISLSELQRALSRLVRLLEL